MNAERVPILMYHEVCRDHDKLESRYCVTRERFAAHLRNLANAGWRAVTVDDFSLWLDGQCSLPEQSLVLTFDDGFSGVYDHACPVLKELGWPATVFLVSALIGEVETWRKIRNPAVCPRPLLNIQQINVMQRDGWSFHGHSRSHRDLTTLSETELTEQVAGCRQDLLELGLTPRFFAYPYGRFGEREAAAVRSAGYAAAFTTQPGFNRPDVDRLRIRRLDVLGTDTPAMLERKVALGSNDGSLAAYGRSLLRRFAARASF